MDIIHAFCLFLCLLPLSFGIYFGIGAAQMIKHSSRWMAEFRVTRKQLNYKIGMHLAISAFLLYGSVVMCLAAFKR